MHLIYYCFNDEEDDDALVGSTSSLEADYISSIPAPGLVGPRICYFQYYTAALFLKSVCLVIAMW